MSPEEVAAKRQVLVGALTRCLEASRVKEIVPLETIRSLLQSASGELWREGEFRLELVWKVLCQQPGISPQDVAPPLLLFKSFESELEVNVRLPPALSALPPGEQTRLRQEVPLTKETFTAEIKELAAAVAAKAAEAPPPPTAKVEMGQAAQAAVEAAQPVRPQKKPISRGQKIAVGVFAALSVCAAGASLYWSMRDTAQESNLADVAPILQLSDGKRSEHSMTARINDPRWETLNKEEQRRIAGQLFDREKEKGIKVLTLVDGRGRVRVSASNATGQTLITIR